MTDPTDNKPLSWLCVRCGQAHFERETKRCVNIRCRLPRRDWRQYDDERSTKINNERNKFIHKYGETVVEV